MGLGEYYTELYPFPSPASIYRKEIEMLVTKEFIHSGKRGPGGWCAAQLRMLGLRWPAKSGWIDRTVSRNLELSDEAASLFIKYGQGEVSKTKIRKYNRKNRKT